MILVAIACLTGLGVILGLILGIAARQFAVEAPPIQAEIEAMLPGSQCGQCGFAGCAGLAAAVANGQASPAACTPGGHALAVKLAALVGVVLEDDNPVGVPKVAYVGESKCVGCAKCSSVCPTDAIVGAPRQIHAVMQQYCTACGLCVDACPTETIQLEDQSLSLDSWRWPKPATRAA